MVYLLKMVIFHGYVKLPEAYHAYQLHGKRLLVTHVPFVSVQ